MSKFLRVAIAITAITMGASLAQAQSVGMAGSYSEGNGIIVNIPQNPPSVPCDPATARCLNKRDLTPADLTAPGGVPLPVSLGGKPFLNSGPQVGVQAAQFIPDGSLLVGGQFTIPTLAFTQMLGVQVGQVLNAAVVQLDTDFTAAMPGAHRQTNNGISSLAPGFVIPPQTRSFALRTFNTADRIAFGQNNGKTTMDPGVAATTGGATAIPPYLYRQAVNTTITDLFVADTLRMVYANTNEINTTAGPGTGTPVAFTGTMTTLLDGTGVLYIDSPGLAGLFGPGTNPIVATNPLGGPTPGLNERNGAGWGMLRLGDQIPGLVKGFGPNVPFIPFNASTTTRTVPWISNPGIIASKCGLTAPNDTCNLIDGNFFTEGYTFFPFGAATSRKYMFAWTTGTVSIVRTGPRQGVIHTLTQTGMGYDSVTGTGTNVQRNIGLVAGSYTKRVSASDEQMNTQIVGVDMKFTPEPGATVALISGLGLLGALAARRRS